MATHSSTLAWKIPWATIHRVTKSRTRLSNFTFTYIYIPSSPQPTPLDHHEHQAALPVIQQFPARYLFYTRQYVYVIHYFYITTLKTVQQKKLLQFTFDFCLQTSCEHHKNETLLHIRRNAYNMLLSLKIPGCKMAWQPLLWSDIHTQNELAAENQDNKCHSLPPTSGKIPTNTNLS